MKDLLSQAAQQMNISLEEKQLQQFLRYKELLLEWNEKMNLTAITDEREIILKHFIDCISILSVYTPNAKATLIDVGTGAGFPGVPLKIAIPSLKVTLLDSLNKRINFLKELTENLELQNIQCIHSRAEEAGKNKLYREKYDICVSRAVANLATLSEYCLPFVKVGGEFIALKGPDVEEELNSSKKAIKTLGGEITDVKVISIPFTDINHSIVMIKKVRQTPSQYPRKAGTASKEPIK